MVCWQCTTMLKHVESVLFVCLTSIVNRVFSSCQSRYSGKASKLAILASKVHVLELVLVSFQSLAALACMLTASTAMKIWLTTHSHKARESSLHWSPSLRISELHTGMYVTLIALEMAENYMIMGAFCIPHTELAKLPKPVSLSWLKATVVWLSFPTICPVMVWHSLTFCAHFAAVPSTGNACICSAPRILCAQCHSNQQSWRLLCHSKLMMVDTVPSTGNEKKAND